MPPPTPEVPAPVARVAGLMSTFPGAWALCGGWAVDAWLGRITRDHADVDVVVFEDDQVAIPGHLSGWQLVAHDDNWSGDDPVWANVPIAPAQLWTGRRVEVPGHFHCRAEDGFDFELNLNERAGGDWIFSREPRLTLPLSQCVGVCGWAVPVAAPLVVAYYKLLPAPFKNVREAMRPRDELDLDALLPLLDPGQTTWLARAVAAVEPGHSWLPRLSS
ncbi:MAG: hypothetical protein HY875_08510 [Chloroflexi bacterium]|nr:hypothetical protein [Chloroflexota bacterium]